MGKINQTAGFAILTGSLLMMLSYMALICPTSIPHFYEHYPVTFKETAPTFFIGCIIGSICSCSAAYFIGRRITLGITGAFTSVGLIMVTVEYNIILIHVGRFLMGLSVGGVQAVMPIYFGEIADKTNRGALGATLSVSLHIGKIFDILLRRLAYYQTHQILLIVLGSIFTVLFLIFGLETPHYYMQKNKRNNALVNLQRFRFASPQKVVEELEDIQGKAIHWGKEKVMTCFKSNAGVKSLTILLGLNFLLYISMVDRVSTIDYFTFEVGRMDFEEFEMSLIIGITQVASSLFCMSIIDRAGRKICLLISIAGILLSVLILLIFRNFTHTPTPIIAFIYFIISSSVGIPSVPFVLLGELFSPKFKMMGAAIVNVEHWLMTCLAYYFLEISVSHGVWLSIILSYCIVAAVFVYFCFPETKGKSFSEIQANLRRI